MRASLVIALSLFVVCVACSSSGDGTESTSGGNAGSNNGSGGSASGGGGTNSSGGDTSSTGERAQIRFAYESDWKDHLGSCASISDYRIKFGAIPVPVSAPIDVTSNAPTSYVEVDGRTYADGDVLHIFTCSKSQTSKQTLQLFGKFGIDLPLMPLHKYTVTLAGSAASLAEDP